MPEQLRQLSDFFDPTRAGMAAINVMQNRQHLAMQQQNMEINAKHTEVQNLKAALGASNPMESYPLYARLMEMNGQAPPGVNEYYANTNMYNKLVSATPGTPEHTDAMDKWSRTSEASRKVIEGENSTARARAGAGTLLAQAGMPADANTAELMRQSGPMQSQVTDALAQSELQKEKARALGELNEENQRVATFANAQLSTLIPAAKAAGLAIERAAPFVAMNDAVEQEYNKNVTSLGKDKAYGIRQEKMAVNQEYMQFDQRRRDSIPKLQQGLQQIEDQQTQLQSRAELIAQGVEPLKEGESLELLAGQVDSSQHQLAYTRASLAFAKNPTPENHSALRNVKDEMDKTVATLSERKKSSMESMNIRRAGLDEKMREFTYNANRKSDIGSAQADWMEAGGNVKDLPEIARKYNVTVAEIRDAAKDPNHIQTQVTIGQEKAEAQTVGKGFGELFIDSQKAGVTAAGRLSKLERMETLLDGITTGKLTPTITDLQALGESMGLKIDSTLPAKQAYQALSGEIALQLRNPALGAGMPGQLSDHDLKFLQSMTADLAKTKEGNHLILSTARKIAKREQDVARIARDYRRKHGQIDEGLFAELQEFGEANPLFSGKSITLSDQAPATSRPAPKGTLSPQEQSELDTLRKKYGR